MAACQNSLKAHGRSERGCMVEGDVVIVGGTTRDFESFSVFPLRCALISITADQSQPPPHPPPRDLLQSRSASSDGVKSPLS